jgi:hypothetical protein
MKSTSKKLEVKPPQARPKRKGKGTRWVIGGVSTAVLAGILYEALKAWNGDSAHEKKEPSGGSSSTPQIAVSKAPIQLVSGGNSGNMVQGTQNNNTQNIFIENGFIKGTHVTESDLDTDFPFGWVVFFLHQGEQTIHKVDPGGHLKYTINWDDVIIKPNQSDRTVEWTIPHFSVSGKSHGVDNTVQNAFKMLDDIEGVHFFYDFFFESDQPTMGVETLSNDQRNPIFALGFRVVKPLGKK